MSKWLPWPTHDGFWWFRVTGANGTTVPEPARVRTNRIGEVVVDFIGVEWGSSVDELRQDDCVYEWLPMASPDAATTDR